MRIFLLLLAAALSTFGQCRSVIELAHQADIVVYARVERVLEVTTAKVSLQFAVEQTLKGNVPASVTGSFAPRRQGSMIGPPSTFPLVQPAPIGIWFWKEVSPGIVEVLPYEINTLELSDLFVPVTPATASLTSLEQRLLERIVASYRLRSDPTTLEQMCFEGSVSGAVPADILYKSLEPLFQSTSVAKRRSAYTIALRPGILQAMQRLLTDWPSIASDARIGDVLIAIGGYPNGKDASWIEPIRVFVERYGSAPGVEAAALGAWIHIGTKPVVPLIASRFETKDAQSQGLLVRFFGLYSMGMLPNSEDRKSPGRLSSDEAQSHMTRAGAPQKAADFIPYWKAWWERNRTRIEAEAAATR